MAHARSGRPGIGGTWGRAGRRAVNLARVVGLLHGRTLQIAGLRTPPRLTPNDELSRMVQLLRL